MGELPREMIVCLDELEWNGGINKRNQEINIPDEHITYDTFDEILG